MSKVFFTGDRSMTPFYPGLVIIEMFKRALAGDTILTGENTGVEAIVRDVAQAVGLEVEVVSNADTWDARHESLADDVQVLAFHFEPMASSVVQSLFRVLPTERVTLVGELDVVG